MPLVRGAPALEERWARWVVLGALSFGCVEDEKDGVEDGEQTEAFCQADCARAFECGSAGRESCETYCEATVTGLDRMRPEVVEIAAECIRDIPCSEYFGVDAFLPCWEQAAREAGPTEALRRFCQEWSRGWFECGASYSVERCEVDWGLYKGFFLERMVTCAAEETCDEIVECQNAVRIAP